MEPLPKGANFIRAKMLWEIGLHIAGNPLTPYGGNRDTCITVGSGGQDTFKPSLRLGTGSAIMENSSSHRRPAFSHRAWAIMSPPRRLTRSGCNRTAISRFRAPPSVAFS